MTDHIIHFVGFITKLERTEFVKQWTPYASQFPSAPGDVILQEKSHGDSKYKYLSQHELGKQDFSFSFMKGRNSENFPEQKVRVAMLGGYYRSKEFKNQRKKYETRLMVFSGKDHFDPKSYADEAGGVTMQVYEPFYESCQYNLIIEYSAAEAVIRKIADLLMNDKQVEAVSLYKTCRTSQLHQMKGVGQAGMKKMVS